MSSTQRQASDGALHCIQIPVYKMEENRRVVEETQGLPVSISRDSFNVNVTFAVVVVAVAVAAAAAAVVVV